MSPKKCSPSNSNNKNISWKSLPSTISTTENSSLKKLLDDELQDDSSQLSTVSEETKSLLNSNLDAIYLVDKSTTDDNDEKWLRDSLSFSTLLNVESAIEHEKAELTTKQIFKDDKSTRNAPRVSSNLDKKTKTSLDYKYYLGVDSSKQENSFRNKYLKAVNLKAIPAVEKSPVVKGPRVSQIKSLFENISRTSAYSETKKESKMPMPAYLRSKVSKQIKSYFKNSTFVTGRESPKMKNKTTPNKKISSTGKFMKRSVPTIVISKLGSDHNTSMIYRHYILKNNSKMDYKGVSNSPIRPVYQTRKLFSPKSSRAVQRKKFMKSEIPANQLVVFAK